MTLAEDIKLYFPQSDDNIIEHMVEMIPEFDTRFHIHAGLRLQHFFAQCAEESAGFRTTVEYASGREYEGRRDLGNNEPGDGERYKGRGLIQLTGRANYHGYGKMLGVDLEGNPFQVADWPLAGLVAGQYWLANGLNVLADGDELTHITRIINGGTNGLQERLRCLGIFKKLLVA